LPTTTLVNTYALISATSMLCVHPIAESAFQQFAQPAVVTSSILFRTLLGASQIACAGQESEQTQLLEHARARMDLIWGLHLRPKGIWKKQQLWAERQVMLFL